ncbi:MAG: hypothetical protein HKN79_05180 [Flavobacteriales bacterium]|nr:hypothetical protein [Flavobacteriales bacterium]
MTLTRLFFTLALAFFLTPTTILGQAAADDRMYHDEELREGHTVSLTIPAEASKEQLEDFMDDRYDVNLKGGGLFSNKDVLSAEEISIPALYPESMDLYFRVIPVGNESKVKVTARDSGDTYFGASHMNTTFEALGRILNDYSIYAENRFYTDRLNERQEQVEDVMKDIQKNEEDIEKNKSKIQDNLDENAEMESENRKMSAEIEDLEKDLKKLKEQIEGAKRSLNEANEK